MANKDATCRAVSNEPRVHCARLACPPVGAHLKFNASALRVEIVLGGLFSKALDVQVNVRAAICQAQ
jgi:hypothetical protein